MKKTAKKSTPSVPSSNKIIVNQFKKTLNEKLTPVLNAISVYQATVQDGMLLLRSLQETQGKRRTPHKQVNLLLVVPNEEELHGIDELRLEESFRHLTKDVSVVPYDHPSLGSIGSHSMGENDLILVVGGAKSLPLESAAALKASPARRALWLSDDAGPTEEDRSLAPMFDYVFTQRAAHLPVYRSLTEAPCRCLPFPADTGVYAPKQVGLPYRSDVLLLGDAEPDGPTAAFVRSGGLSERRARAYGEGWGRLDASILPIPTEEELADYCNGAAIVINCSASVRRVLDVSACGAFQLVEDRLRASDPEWGEPWVTFGAPDELADKFEFYWTNVEIRRLAATRALTAVKYDHSFLQKGIELLNAVFG